MSCPSPPKLPPKLSWLELFNHSEFNFLEFLLNNSCQFTQKYGDIIRLNPRQMLVTGPNAFKTILKERPENFSKDNRTYERIKYLFGNGLIVSSGSIWEKHQTHLRAFFERSRLENFASIMIQSTLEWIESIKHKTHQKIKKEAHNKEHKKGHKLESLFKIENPSKIDMVQEMTHLTLTIAFRCFANHTPTHKELQAIHYAIIQGTPHISHALFLSPYVPTPKNLIFFWSMKRIENILKSIIQNRNEITARLKEPKDFQEFDYLDLLLSLEKRQDNYRFDMTEILDELKTILFTGYETTACAMIWVWHLLYQYPHYLKLLQEELKHVLNNRTPTLEDCLHLKMTKAIFLETLRLYPPIWCLPRKVLVDENVSGLKIPKNSELILNVHALHRNPHIWEHPDRFMPERFLNDNVMDRNTFSFLPFSIGLRSCLGTQFAITEGIILIAMIAQHFNFIGQYDPTKILPMPLLSLRPPQKLIMKPVLNETHCKR